jgi:hypothetical protein
MNTGASDMDEIDVTPRWWNALYTSQRWVERYAIVNELIFWVRCQAYIGGKFGDAMGKVYCLYHGDDSRLAMYFNEDHGLNLDALRGAVLDRLDSPDMENSVNAAAEAARAQWATISVHRVGP